MKTEKEIMEALRDPFPEEDLEWLETYGGRKTKLPYVQARAIMERLDKVFGMGWSTTYAPAQTTISRKDGEVIECGAQCTITVRLPDGTTASRTDAGESSNISPLKGGYSAALKRAAVHFGIGRYLYYLPFDTKPGTLPSWALPGGAGHPPSRQETAATTKQESAVPDHLAEIENRLKEATSQADLAEIAEYAKRHKVKVPQEVTKFYLARKQELGMA